MATYGTAHRRGLPRHRGGEAWPPASEASESVETSPPDAVAETTTVDTTSAVEQPRATEAPLAAETPAAPAAASAPAASASTAAEPAGSVRRGLPRVAGGEPWPPATTVVAARAAAAAPEPETSAPESPAPAPVPAEPAPAAPVAAEPAPAAAPEAPAPASPRPDVAQPLTTKRTVWPGQAASSRPVMTREPRRIGPFTIAQWLGVIVLAGPVLLVLALLVVVAAGLVLQSEPMASFVVTYPGEYELPEGAPVGLPAWLGWQHFFNVFFMVLIIRTGLQVRREKRPSAFWAPKNNPRGKTSLTIWTHQALDVLWVVNGVVFVVLLFATGQWMRIVPTSWDVFPNALSALLQYVSLDWPTENGWVRYNSLQQLTYFATVFIAAPLAVISGVRMSTFWPKKAPKLNRLYPIEWARKVHFPTMLYFVIFIVVHVGLVFATGALRNLNHMYAAQGSEDGIQYAGNWTGFWIFFASLVVIAAAWVALRPLTVAPIARLFGNVSSR